MQPKDETKQLVKSFQDKSRKIRILGKRQGGGVEIPHKLTAEGDIPESPKQVTFDRLDLKDLRFLVLWKKKKWNNEETLKECGLTEDQAEKTFKKLAYYKTEDAKIKALADQASPEMVLARDVENLHTHKLQDTDHKSLDRIAKITGAFKTTTDININHSLQVPKMSPEAWAAIRAIADKEADVVDGEIIG